MVELATKGRRGEGKGGEGTGGLFDLVTTRHSINMYQVRRKRGLRGWVSV